MYTQMYFHVRAAPLPLFYQIKQRTVFTSILGQAITSVSLCFFALICGHASPNILHLRSIPYMRSYVMLFIFGKAPRITPSSSPLQVAIGFLKEVGMYLQEASPQAKALNGVCVGWSHSTAYLFQNTCFPRCIEFEACTVGVICGCYGVPLWYIYNCREFHGRILSSSHCVVELASGSCRMPVQHPSG